MEFHPQDSVVVSIPQLHGNIRLIEQGEVISVQGSTAQVMLRGEEVPRTVPIDRLKLSEEVFGEQTGHPNELPVIDAIRY